MSRTNPRVLVPVAPSGERTLLGAPNIVVPVKRSSGLAARRIRAALLFLPVFAIGLLLGVRDMARSERALEAEGARAARVIVYELGVGRELRVPIEPGTDVFRVLMHAARIRGESALGPLRPQPHTARVHFHVEGDRGSLDETRSIAVPGTTSRVTAEDPDLVVGDPVGTSLDVHGLGLGQLSISLESVEDAEALLVRVYLRDDLHGFEAIRRREQLDDEKREHDARRAGEIDWADLDDDERIAIAGSRWQKVGALSGSNDLVARAIALAPAETRAAVSRDDFPIVTFALIGDERASFMAHGPTTVHGRVDDPEAPLSAAVRYDDGTIAKVESKGEVVMKVPEGNIVGVELVSDGDRSIEVRAAEPQKIEPPTRAAFWRASPSLPVILEGGSASLIVRVTARRSVPRVAVGGVPMGLAVTLTSRAGAATTERLAGERPRSKFDCYEGPDPAAAPTEKLVFYVVVPAGGAARITPADGALDLSLAELDPLAGARDVASFALGSRRDLVAKVGEVDWSGFVARRPSNAASFEPDAHGLLRIAHRYVPVPDPAERPPTFRIARPRVAAAIRIEDRVFDPADAELSFSLRDRQSIALPVRLYAPDAVTLTARIDGGNPRRIESGVASRVTTDRRFEISGERDAVVVLGDDLAPGEHTLKFDVVGGKRAWVHVPWLRRVPGTHPRPKPRATQWTEGDFEN